MLGTELRGKQLGIVGVGRIGRAVAAQAPAFGMTAVFARAARADRRRRGDCRSTSCSSTSDVVSLHVPLTPRDAAPDRSAGAGADEAVGVPGQHGARAGRRRGGARVGARAAADRRRRARRLRATSPTSIRSCSSLENVLLVPHLGSATRETRTAMADLAVRNVLAVLDGQPPLTPVA